MKTIIIGGGIGGLVTAIALLSKGVEVEVYEKSASVTAEGAGLWIGPNALAILNKYGLADQLQKEGMLLRKACITDIEGKKISELDFEKIKDEFQFGNLAIHRADLHRVLLGNIPDGIVRTSKQFTGFKQDADSVTAYFADGTIAKGEILIGADGINSRVRHQLYPTLKLRFSDQTSWRFVTEFELPQHEKQNSYEIWSNKKGLRVGYSYINKGEVYCYITASATEEQKRPEPISQKRILMNLCNGFSPEIKKLIAAAPEDEIIQKNLYDLQLSEKWYSGRVVLAGDAAHASMPNLGQGACQAIEDAYALAKCLTGSKDPVTAFRSYESLRRPKAEYVSRYSWKLGQVVNTEGWKKKLITAIIRLTPSWLTMRQFHSIYSVNYLEHDH
ncbi:MAG TPA: FAD-dependent monooxygenase [Chitinophagaceae bacterium]